MTAAGSQVPSLDPASLRALMEQGVQLLDVRRAPVFAEAAAMIAGASWHDPAELPAWVDQLDRRRPVVVYCVHGHAVSQSAASALRERGFDASYLEGGFEAWQAAGLPLQRRQG